MHDDAAKTTAFDWYEERMLLDSDHAPGGVIVYYADGDEEIIHVNQYVIDLFECDSSEDFMQLTGGSFRTFVHAEDINSAEDSIWGQVEKQDNLDHIYYRIETKSGKLVNIEDFGRLVEMQDGRPVFHVFIIEMKQRGSVDWLTGLPTMVRFHHLAAMGAQAIRDRGEKPAAIALDLVGLKSFNAEYGREAGDKLLCIFADLVRRHFGSEACSRFAEDHFYAFSTESEAQKRVEALFEDFASSNDGNVLPIRVGIYACEPEEDIVAVGFDRAKLACDYDRKTWKSHLMWFSDDMRAELKRKIHVLDHIDDAIAEGWVRPYYQPVVRASTGSVCGEEALARWVDPEYGSLPPSVFIPVLEEAGVLHKLDMHMVDCVLADIKTKWERGVPVVPVSINISLRDLGSVDVAGEILRRVDDAGVSHELIRVEFTESAASHDPQQFRAQVKMLRDGGIGVWMDDFGSGYSSLNTMQEFEFDLIKLDMAFVRNLDSEKARKIVASIISLSTRLGVGTLAEGVETEEQAIFLESVGCSMLQGFFYTEPQPLEIVMGRYLRGVGFMRESMDEFSYWNEIGEVDLAAPTSSVDGHAVDGTPLAEFPAGVMERRGDTWRLLRANDAYREFLDRGGAIPREAKRLQPAVFEQGVDIEYSDAANRSVSTNMWERIAGRMEYGTGLQFFTRPVTSTPEAEAFVLASVPTMLGTALGTYGDVPVAYAVLRVVLSPAGDKAVDAEYVYANTVYCDWCNYERDSLTGKSLMQLTGEETYMWLPYCYRAAVLKEDVNGVLFSPEMGHWLSFNMAPSPIDECFVYAFTIADDEHREREEIIMGRDTSDLIIGITNVFNGAMGYEEAMNRVLEMVSTAVRPERLYIFERGSNTTSGTFEWCAEGIESRMSVLQRMDNADFATWERMLQDATSVIIPDIEELRTVDEELYWRFAKQGIERVMAVPLRNGENLLGFLVADNYSLAEGLDVKRLLETVASFVSARMANERLLDELEESGTHDYLTELLNRRGVDIEISERLGDKLSEPFTLALIDVDDFKTLNDMYGHDVGDAILKSIAQRVKDALSADAIIGRNGGDEFLAMFFGDERARAEELFERICHAEQSVEYNGREYPVSLSIGYVECPEQASSLKEAYSLADRALYAVKLMGKSGFRRYSREIESDYRSLLGFSSRDLAENIPGGILVHKAVGKHEILFANEELKSMMECDSLLDLMQVTHGVSDELVHEDDRAAVDAALASQASTGSVGTKGFSNYRLVTKTGKIKRVAANSRLAEIAGIGKVFYVILVDRDERSVT